MNDGTKTEIMRVRGLKKSFRMGESVVQVLKNVDLAIRAGEFVAIEGRSGSGKSTLLHTMGALDEADEGIVEYEGRDIAALGSAERSKLRNTQFGFVFQFYHLLPELTVLENAMLAPMIEFSWMGFRARKKELRERAVGVLKQLGMDHRLKHRPSQLSGGERQRVAIGRALMNEPKVLFADEPTGNLDTETGGQIMAVLENLHKTRGQTIVMVTHDRTVARKADRVLVLREGRLERADER
ncbi:MAG TPA: ABC transporter ATP-binding protein [Tepidisphaeraceae bacterium]|jgi:lipoprotein-releasing system ATP-binding protein|nr:ABC transporter ATP-binding protein [Tepidisphaeraceae bacterium]